MRRPVALCLALLGALLLGGCVGIPTSGPIGEGDVVLPDPGQPVPLANDPPRDASIEDIVQGFLVASAAGLSDQFAVARKYLTSDAARTWDPMARLVVYPSHSQPRIAVPDGEDAAVVEVDVQGALDKDGVYAESAPGSRSELALTVARDADGQWRIATLDDGFLMPSSDFTVFYRQVPLYFVSADERSLVPDVRWYPAATALTSAVRGLLAGPSPWLADVVRPTVPDGTRLASGEVVLGTGQTAKVDLSAAAAGADVRQRALLAEQLTQTLVHVPGGGVSSVTVTVAGGDPWSRIGDGPLRDPQPSSGPYLLAEGRLQALSDREVVPVGDAGPLPEGAHDPAVSMTAAKDGTLRVVLDGRGRLQALGGAGVAPTMLLDVDGLLSPSVDPYDWTWTSAPGSSTLLAVRGDEVVEVDADWLTGATVRSLALSRDGTRIAVVHTGAGDQDVTVDVASVPRDAQHRPQPRLGDRFQVGASITAVSQVEWMDEATLAVLGTSGSLDEPAVHVVPVGGQSTALPLVLGARMVAAGRGDRALFVTDDQGTLWWRQGAAWVKVAEGVADPAFPG